MTRREQFDPGSSTWRWEGASGASSQAMPIGWNAREEQMRVDNKCILLSGVIAGMIIIASAAAMVLIVGNEMDQVLADRGLPPLGGPAMVFFGVFSLAMGIVLAWLYAVLRAHFGAGNKTAAIASFIVWLLAYFFSNAAKAVYGFMPIRLVMIGTAWGLAELLAAGLVGARLYEKRSGSIAVSR